MRGNLNDPRHIELDEPVTELHGMVEVILRAAPSLSGVQAARALSPARDDEIDALYADVHALAAASASGEPTADARYRERLARLRELQDAETREMAAFAERRRDVPRGAAAAVLDHVDALLEAHEHSSGSDRTGGNGG